ncbi:MAG: hypothetical protein AAF654_13145 [Myxococcota bacterium]
MRANGFELWVFRRRGDGDVEYLVFEGGDSESNPYGSAEIGFVPNGFVEGDPLDALRACTASMGLAPLAFWFGEHAFTTFDFRHGGVTHFTVFAAEVAGESPTPSGAMWFARKDAEMRIYGRGSAEGLYWVRRTIVEATHGAPVRLWTA